MRQIRFEIVNDAVKENAIRQIREIQPDSKSPLIITIQEKTRSLSQNSLLWALLTDISDQVNWYGKKLSSEDWKAVFTAGLKNMASCLIWINPASLYWEHLQVE